MDNLKQYLEEIDGKTVSLDEAFEIMENIYKMEYGYKEPEQLELDLKLE